MTKQHFIALADMIKKANHPDYWKSYNFNEGQINMIADFCREQNPNFNRERWLSYIKGECGSNGGKVKTNNLKTAGVQYDKL